MSEHNASYLGMRHDLPPARGGGYLPSVAFSPHKDMHVDRREQYVDRHGHQYVDHQDHFTDRKEHSKHKEGQHPHNARRVMSTKEKDNDSDTKKEKEKTGPLDLNAREVDLISRLVSGDDLV
jgi:hypothetical protein